MTALEQRVDAAAKVLGAISWMRKATELGGLDKWYQEVEFVNSKEDQLKEILARYMNESLPSDEELAELVKYYWISLGDPNDSDKEYSSRLEGYLRGFEHIVSMKFNKNFKEKHSSLEEEVNKWAYDLFLHLLARICDRYGVEANSVKYESKLHLDPLMKGMDNLPKRIAYYSVRSCVAIRHEPVEELVPHVREVRQKIVNERAAVMAATQTYMLYNQLELVLMKKLGRPFLIRWVTDGYRPPASRQACLDCLHKELDGWRSPRDKNLSIPPLHPYCRCILAYSLLGGDEENADL